MLGTKSKAAKTKVPSKNTPTNKKTANITKNYEYYKAASEDLLGTKHKTTTPQKTNTVQTLVPLSPQGIASVKIGGTDNKVVDSFGNAYYDDPKIPNKMQEFKKPENVVMPDNKETVLEVYKKNTGNIPLLSYNQNTQKNTLVSKSIPNNTLTVPKISEENKRTVEPFNADSVLNRNEYIKSQIEKEKIKLTNSYNGNIYSKSYDVAKKYGYDPETISFDDLMEWTNKHNFKLEGSADSGVQFVPKRDGLFGKKLTTEEEENDFKLLEALVGRNLNYQMGKDHPVLSSALTIAGAVPRSVASLIATVEDTINVSQGKEIDPLSNAHRAGNTTNEIRRSVDKHHASKAFGGKELPVIGNVGSFLYNAGMSMGDSAITLATGQALFGGISNVETARKAISGFVSASMASSAAADAVVTGIERGLPDARALGLGIATGLVEAATEKYSIDNILKQPKTFLKGLARGFVAEGSEEGVAEVTTGFVDLIINGSDSELVARYNEYKKLGYDNKTAMQYTLADSASQVASSILAGGLSGMGMSFSSQLGTSIRNRQTAHKLGISTNQFNTLNSTDNKKVNKTFKGAKYSEIVKPLIEVNNEIIALQKQGKENTPEYAALKVKKAGIIGDVISEVRKDKAERAKYYSLSSDINKLKIKFSHATDEKITELSQTVSEINEFHKNPDSILDENSEAYKKYEQLNENLHTLVDELSFEERKYKYKDVHFASVADSARISDSDVELFDKLSKIFGTKFVVDSNLQYEGEYMDGTIFVNPNSKSIHQNVFAHELVHHGENSPKYEEFKREIFEGGRVSAWAQRQSYDSLEQLKSAYAQSYKTEDMRIIESEIVADYVADILTQDVSYLHRMAQQDTGFRKILNYIRDFFTNIKDKLGISNSDSKYASDIVSKLTDVLNTVENVNTFNNETQYKIPLDNQITMDDVKKIQSIGRKSINELSNEELKLIEPIARKLYGDLGVKSPFFRAWFGDWREFDKTPVHIVTEKGYARGITKNSDTGWDIQISGKVFNETKAHKQIYNINAQPYLDYINSIVENAVLFDSHIISADKAKSEKSMIMHSFYAIADIGSGKQLLKLYVEELNDVNSDGTIKRSYQLQNIVKQQLNDRVQDKSLAPSASTADELSISDLFQFVKTYDKNFNPKPASKVVNEDGTPKVVYHGSAEKFNIFDITKSRSWNGTPDYDLPGFYFSENNEESSGYGDIRSFYIKITNPYTDTVYSLAKEKGSYRKAYEYLVSEGYDGVIINDMGEGFTEYIVLKPENIKSATDNIGTFNKNNPDVRYKINLSQNNNIVEDYKKDVKKFFEDGIVPQKGYFDLGFPTKILADKIKSQNNIIMRDDVLVKATGNKHSISIEEMSKLAEKIQDPLMIFKSDTVKNAYVLFVEMKNNYNIPVVVAIHLNKFEGRSRVTNISSVHSRMNTETYKDHTQSFIDNQVKKGNFVYANKKSQSWFSTFGLRLPSVVQTYIDSNNSISQENGNVNKNPSQNNNSRKKIASEDIYNNYLMNQISSELASDEASSDDKEFDFGDSKLNEIINNNHTKPTEGDITKWQVANNFKNGPHLFINNDLSRNLDYLAGNNKLLRIFLRNEIEIPFFKAKANFTNSMTSKLDSFYNVIVGQYGIKLGSKESAALQWYGEGYRQYFEYKTVDGKKTKFLKQTEYTLANLKRDFPNDWFRIAMADKYIRKIYNDYLDAINKVLEEIYPTLRNFPLASEARKTIS